MQNVAFSAVLPGQDQLPSEDGEPMETGFHDAQDALLKDTLLDAWPERRWFVAGNMFVEGFALDSSRRAYTPLAADERGDLLVAPLGLKLGLRRTRYRNYDQRFVRWLDLDGNPLPTAQERTEAERARADAERARADAAERRLAELERKLAEKER